MKNILNYLILLTSISLFTIDLNSAETVGSFDVSLSFDGSNRTVSCYVPTDYDKSKPYSLMIGLHGAGDNSINFRNVLINNGQWNTIFKNTILVFPDGGNDQAKDFYSPQGDERIIDIVMKWASDNYTINNDSIYLCGFSLGGRSALRYGLDNTDKISGLLLLTPAVQSPMDVQNKFGFSLMFNYQNSNKIPIAISMGDLDAGFVKTVKMLADSLVHNNSNVLYVVVPGMGHNIPPNQLTEYMFKFLTTPVLKATPVIHSLSGDLINYDGKAPLKCRVRNMGETPITSLTFDYKVNETTKSVDYTGNISKGNFFDFILPDLDLPDGSHSATITITKCNDEIVNPNPSFNLGEYSFNVWKNSLPLPFTEDFVIEDKIYDNFTVQESGNFISWGYENSIGKDGAGSMIMLNSQLAYLNFGLIESLYTNRFDFSNAVKPFISFDLAFNYTYYLPPYVQSKTDFTDTLQIFVSNDNWKTSTSIFKKWGSDLLTFAKPLENPLTLQEFLVPPTLNDWKNIEIDLKDFNVNENTMFRFDMISGMGGIIFLDNFRAFDKDAVSVAEIENSEFKVYPNPAGSNESIVITLNSSVNDKLNIELFDILGQKVFELNNQTISIGDNSFSFILPNLSSGMYIIKANVNNTEVSKNIIIK